MWSRVRFVRFYKDLEGYFGERLFLLGTLYFLVFLFDMWFIIVFFDCSVRFNKVIRRELVRIW